MGLSGAIAQIAIVATILLAGSLYTKHHVAHMQRADHSAVVYMEDSRAGNGTRYRILARAADSHNASYTVEVLVRGTAEGFVHGLAGSLPGHTHPQQDEVLQVKQGKLGVIQGKGMNQQAVLAAGEQITIHKGTPHTLYNADNSSAVLFELHHTPAGPMAESFFENLAGLGWAYTSLDRLHPLQVLVLYDDAGIVLYDLPSFLQPVVKTVLVPVAKLLGFKSHYPSHTSAARGQPAVAESKASAGAAAAHQIEQQTQEKFIGADTTKDEMLETELQEYEAAAAAHDHAPATQEKEEL